MVKIWFDSFHAVIPFLLEWLKPSLILTTVLVTALNRVVMPRKGTTDRKGRQNNAVIIELHNAKTRHAKNDRHKKTAFNDCGVLSPFLNGLPHPPPMFRGALRITAWFSCVNFSGGNIGNVGNIVFKLFAPKNKKVIIESSPPIYEYPQRAMRLFVDQVLQVVGIFLI